MTMIIKDIEFMATSEKIPGTRIFSEVSINSISCCCYFIDNQRKVLNAHLKIAMGLQAKWKQEKRKQLIYEGIIVNRGDGGEEG